MFSAMHHAETRATDVAGATRFGKAGVGPEVGSAAGVLTGIHRTRGQMVSFETVGDGGRRPDSVEGIRAVFDRMLTADGVAAGLAFEPRPDDVVISSFAKCGTTWLQQIVHSLRSNGHMEFDEISQVVPWIEPAADLGIDLDAEQTGHPRAFKSHLAWDPVPKGGRFIVSVRDPLDAALSVYRFFEGWFFEPGTLDVETFVRSWFLDSRNYYTHLGSWWPRRHQDDVLLLAYEHMKADLEGTVARVADFIGVRADDELLELAARQSSFEAMTANKSKYSETLMRGLSETAGGLPPDSESSKVRTGQVGGHSVEFSDDLVAEFQTTWDETLGDLFGLADYGALLKQLAGET